jgi:hypothetical protein
LTHSVYSDGQYDVTTTKQTLDDLALTDSKWLERDVKSMPDINIGRLEYQKYLINKLERLKTQ